MDALYRFVDHILSLVGPDASPGHRSAKAIGALLAAALVWIVVKWITTTLAKKSARFSRLQERMGLVTLLRQSAGIGLIWAVGLVWIRVFDLSAAENLLHALCIVLIAGPLKAFLIITLEYLERHLAERTDTVLDNIVINLLNRLSGAVVYVTAGVLALDVLGVNVLPFVAGAGVMGVAVGFAAKDTLSNLIAGILLIIDRPFEVGDRIEVWSAPAGSASWGDVIDIGLRATRIRTTDNIVVIIPNNEIMTRDIVNYTCSSNDIRVRVNIGIAYDADIARAKALILEAARSAEWIQAEPAPRVVVRSFGESAVDLQARVWIKDARRRMDTIDFITDTVKTLFDRNGIEIPYPKRDITIVDRHPRLAAEAVENR